MIDTNDMALLLGITAEELNWLIKECASGPPTKLTGTLGELSPGTTTPTSFPPHLWAQGRANMDRVRALGVPDSLDAVLEFLRREAAIKRADDH